MMLDNAVEIKVPESDSQFRLKPCKCGSDNVAYIWMVRILPKRWIFTKYYMECAKCHYCGKTRIGKRRAIRAWNKEVIYAD